MIVKNEEKNLPRLFSSLQKYVDYYVISDTGSTDNTIAIIKELGEKYHIDGVITQDEWVNFAHNRNIALQNAFKAYSEKKHECKWLLIIDADEELIVQEPDFIADLNPDKSYSIYKKDKGAYFRHLGLVCINQKKWQWNGVTHNYLISKSENYSNGFLSKCYIKCNNFEGAKSRNFKNQIEKSLKDIEYLEDELNDSVPNIKNIHRYFILANECFEAKLFDKAIANYEIIVSNSHDIDIKYIALIQLGVITFEALKQTEKAIEIFEKAIELDKNRKEAFYYMGMIYRHNFNMEKALEILEKADELSFVNPNYYVFDYSIYSWKIKFELLTIYHYLRNTEKTKLLIGQLINNEDVPKFQMTFISMLKQKF